MNLEHNSRIDKQPLDMTALMSRAPGWSNLDQLIINIQYTHGFGMIFSYLHGKFTAPFTRTSTIAEARSSAATTSRERRVGRARANGSRSLLDRASCPL